MLLGASAGIWGSLRCRARGLVPRGGVFRYPSLSVARCRAASYDHAVGWPRGPLLCGCGEQAELPSFRGSPSSLRASCSYAQLLLGYSRAVSQGLVGSERRSAIPPLVSHASMCAHPGIGVREGLGYGRRLRQFGRALAMFSVAPLASSGRESHPWHVSYRLRWGTARSWAVQSPQSGDAATC